MTFLAALPVEPVLAQTSTTSPPGKDDFAYAEVVWGLPFTEIGDLAGTTSEPGEPSSACLPSPQETAWYLMTPSTSGLVRVATAGSSPFVSVVAYRQTGSGFGGLSLVGCGGGFGGAALMLDVTAGSTYYLQAGLFVPGPGHLELRIDTVTAPANDDFDGAEALPPAPVTVTPDLTAATAEPGEPAPGGAIIERSVWYSYTPATSGTVVLRPDPDPSTRVGVYTGSSLSGLTEVVGGAPFIDRLYFTAEAGTTYYIQLARTAAGFGPPQASSLVIEDAGAPSAAFVVRNFAPSIHEDVEFLDVSGDPAFIGFRPGQWDFGDGSTATGCCVAHRYGADGDYLVTLTVTTLDGRTDATTQVVSIRTHDVAIERLRAPSSAHVGQSRNVRVDLRGGRYPETVSVALYRSTAGSADELVDTRTVTVPAGGRVGADFTYTFTADDGATGKVTFRVEATLVDARDALPADNHAIAPPTQVKR